MVFVYIIQSKNYGNRYVGISSNVEKDCSNIALVNVVTPAVENRGNSFIKKNIKLAAKQ